MRVVKHLHNRDRIEEYIKDLIAKKYTLKQVSDFTGYTVVHLCNLKKKYLQKGSKVFINGHKGKTSKNKISSKMQKKIVEIYKKDFKGFNFLFFTETLKELYNIKLSYKSIYSILTKNKIQSPEKHKIPKNKKAKRPRQRREQAGDLIQLDATPYQWFLYCGDTKYYTLHGAIDDATGQITGLTLTENECSYGYYDILEQTFNNFGIPHEVYTDRSSIFCVSPKDKENLTIQEQLEGIHAKKTQWQKILASFSINQILAWSPQAKGRIERLWRTLQGRLPWYFWFYKIKTIEEANTFLQKEYIKLFNKEFATKNDSYVWRIPPKDFFKNICSKFSRKTNSVGIISFQGYKFLVEAPHCSYTNITLCIFKNKVEALINDTFYPVKLIDELTGGISEIMSDSLKNILYKYMYSDVKKVCA